MCSDIVELRGSGGQARGRGGEHGDARCGLGEQRDVVLEREASGDDAGERLLRQAAVATLRAASLIGDDASVALGPDGAGTDEHGVDGGAQRVKQGAVGRRADRSGATVDGRAPVGGGDHVEHHVGARGHDRGALPQSEAADDLGGGGGSAGGEQRIEDRLAFARAALRLAGLAVHAPSLEARHGGRAACVCRSFNTWALRRATVVRNGRQIDRRK